MTDILETALEPSLPEGIPALGRAEPTLRVPEIDDAERDEARRRFAARARPAPRDMIARASPQYVIPVEWVFGSLPLEEAKTLFRELARAGALFAPGEHVLRYLVAELGEEVLPFVERWAAGAPFYAAELGSREATRVIARFAVGDEEERSAEARAWVATHPERAMEAMLELAGAEPSLAYATCLVGAREWLAARDAAALGPAIDLALAVGEPPAPEPRLDGSPARTLRWLVRRLGREAVFTARPDAPRERVDALLDARWDQRGSVQAALPKWWPVEVAITRADGSALEGEARARVFALCERALLPEHPQLVALRAALGPESALRAADAIVDAFVADKAKPMYRWTLLAALGLAPEAMVPRLARLAWGWSRDDNRNHRNLVVPVIEWLARVTDAGAVTRISLLAEGLRQATHRRAAESALALIALEGGASERDLAATALPDLGLGADGTVRIDYGARAFVARFGPDGRPSFTDASGKALSKLPKPGKKDDAELAGFAMASFAELAEEVRHLVRAESRRLEEALRRGRRWTAAQLRATSAHPLRRVLASSLLWSTGAHRFRVSEELEWLDADDVPVSVAADALVGLAHPIEMSDAERERWGAVWGDYALVAPFPQLSREVHRAEVRAGRVDACEGWSASTGALVGLLSNGWAATYGHGGLGGASRQLEGGRASIEWEPFSPRDVATTRSTTLGALEVSGAAAEPAILSELLLDLSRAKRA